jgi:hypothetical protein
MTNRISKRDIERLLTDTLIPVEPNQDFLTKLQARLVTYRGRSPVNIWMIIAVMATVLLIAISALGLIIRIVVAIGGLVGILVNRRDSSSRPGVITT